MIACLKEFPKKKMAALLLVVLPLVPLSQQFAQAGPLGVAGDYNVFVFGDIEQWGTDVEGRVAAGGTAIYGRPDGVDINGNVVNNGFAVASKTADHALNLVAGNTVVLQNGSVGYLEPGNSGSAISQKGVIVHGASGVPVIPADVGYGSLQNGLPIDFATEEAYLKRQSAYWGTLTPTSGNIGLFGNIDLTGTDPTLNIFSLGAADFTQTGFRFDFHVSSGSTVLVNIRGEHVDLTNFGFYFNGLNGEPPHAPGGPEHDSGYPYASILFNFLDATDIQINDVAINGSMLAPFAHVEFGEQSHIDGNLIAASLTGQGESHNRLFGGELPVNVPEPATLLLLAGGMVGMAVRRRPLARTAPGS